MNKHLQYYWYSESSKVRNGINGFLYFIRKIPFIGKKISVTIFKQYELKQIIFVLGIISKISIKILFKFIWMGLCILFASLFTETDNLIAGLFFWLLIIAFLGNYITRANYRFSEKQIHFQENYALSQPMYVQSQIFIDIVYNAVAYMFPMIIVGFILKKPLLVPLLTISSYCLGALLAIILERKLYSRKTIIKVLSGLLYCGIPVSVTILMLKKQVIPIFMKGYLSWFSLITCSVLCVACLYFLLHLKDEDNYIRYLLHVSNDNIAKVKTQSSETTKYLGQNFTIQLDAVEDKIQNKHGVEYLNALLFQRYQKTLLKELRIRILGIAIVGVGMIIAMKIVSWQSGMIFDEKKVTTLFPMLFFFLYLLNFAKKIVVMAFTNCDSAMLYYPFYREPKTILRGFFYRLKTTFFYNSFLCITIFAIFVLLNIVHGFFLSFDFFLALAFLLISLAFLFSFHELFIYYLLQPYTSKMEIKNPVYNIISGIMYMIAYMNLQIKAQGLSYALIVSVLSLVYCVIGLTITWWKAPKTFRMK